MADLNSQLPVKISNGTLTADLIDSGTYVGIGSYILDGSGNPITSFGGGTQYATNVAYADGNTGTLAITVRDDALSTLTEIDGDYSTLRVDSTGALWVNLADASVVVTATDLDIRNLVNTDVVTAELSATDNAVLDAIAASVAAIDVDATTIIGHVDGIETVLGTIDADTSALAGTVAGTEVQVDIVAALPAGANAIGKLAANSGVDIGDVTINNTEATPVPVYITSGATSGSEVNSYDTSAAIAAAASDNHDYTVTGTTFLLKGIHAAASGKMKIEVQVGPVASLVTKFVGFNSTANPNIDFVFPQPIEVPATGTGTVRIIRTNSDTASQDVYSTIIGSDI